MKKTVHHYLTELEKVQAAGITTVLVAGHAVGLWSEIYRERSPELNKLGPFESKDLDLLCRDEDFEATSKLYPTREVLKTECLTASVKLQDGLSIDFMHTVKGVNRNTIFKNAFSIDFDGVPILVADPIDLFRAKMANAIDLDQENRQDLFQLKALSFVVPLYLNDLLSLEGTGAITAKKIVKKAENLLNCLDREEVPAQLWFSKVDPACLFPKNSQGVSAYEQFLEDKLEPYLLSQDLELDR